MKSLNYIGAVTLLLGAVAGAQSQSWIGQTRIVTASNTPSNQFAGLRYLRQVDPDG